ncbi:hypothetical protein IscW_ISCW018932 [Ixodes scapularis]|uniref:Uncharacterized protein n=1 Tax=Ixodes scapularis TaxID=6945 RepID=B7PL54_IXOSC|nr:hypothetical protein IscW_ISCW018932 [Ixodes scapularis]|eukprot:XP_002434501.1 hypothetical protein IscW_ISCW018932 [Ixodes scapularis]
MHSEYLAGVEGLEADRHVNCHTHRPHNPAALTVTLIVTTCLVRYSFWIVTTVTFVITFQHQLGNFLTCEHLLLSRCHVSDAANESTEKTKLQTLFSFYKQSKLKNSEQLCPSGVKKRLNKTTRNYCTGKHHLLGLSKNNVFSGGRRFTGFLHFGLGGSGRPIAGFGSEWVNVKAR